MACECVYDDVSLQPALDLLVLLVHMSGHTHARTRVQAYTRMHVARHSPNDGRWSVNVYARILSHYINHPQQRTRARRRTHQHTFAIPRHAAHKTPNPTERGETRGERKRECHSCATTMSATMTTTPSTPAAKPPHKRQARADGFLVYKLAACLNERRYNRVTHATSARTPQRVRAARIPLPSSLSVCV